MEHDQSLNKLNALHPFVEGALSLLRDVAWNAASEHFEEPFEITGGQAENDERLLDVMRYALSSGGQGLVAEDQNVRDLELLSAFDRLVGPAGVEYVAVAVSKPGLLEPFTSVFVSKGLDDRVTVPRTALRQIELRIQHGQRFRVAYVHNHPQSILHELLGTAALGPSAQDRTHVLAAYERWLQTHGAMDSRFYLVENGTFRRFVLPAARQVWELGCKLGIVR